MHIYTYNLFPIISQRSSQLCSLKQKQKKTKKTKKGNSVGIKKSGSRKKPETKIWEPLEIYVFWGSVNMLIDQVIIIGNTNIIITALKIIITIADAVIGFYMIDSILSFLWVISSNSYISLIRIIIIPI